MKLTTDSLIDMSFSKDGIAGMLKEYEEDHHTDTDINLIAGLIHNHSFGYPFLVSRICNLLDKRILETEQYPDKKAVWTERGISRGYKDNI